MSKSMMSDIEIAARRGQAGTGSARQGKATGGKRIVVISDLHCGHRVGLTPKRHQPKVDRNAPHYLKKLAQMRAYMWRWFEAAITSVQPIDKLIVNGDAIEGKGEKTGSTELITADRALQAEIAADAINFVGAKEVWATYGTPYHTGAAEDWEDIVYSKVNNFRKIEAEGHYDVNGLQIICKHFIGNSSSPVSRATAISTAQVKQMLWALTGHQPLANLIIRSHIHRSFNFGDTGMNFQSWTTPGLQGLGSKYGARQCDGLPIQFGFLVVNVISNKPGEWGVSGLVAPMKYGASTINKL